MNRDAGMAATSDAGQVDGGCTLMTLAPRGDLIGNFSVQGDREWWTVGISTAPDAVGLVRRVVLMELHQSRTRPVTFPYSVPSLPPDTNWSNCEVCFRALLGCDVSGNCQSEYLATSGRFYFDAGVANASAGIFAVSATDVRYQAWDFKDDRPASDACLIAPQIDFVGTW